MKAIVLILLATLVAGCALTRDPGWEGTDATPFETAEIDCRAQAAESSDYDDDFEACMNRHGWHRP